MNAVRQSYNNLPETISVPTEFVHRKAEIIILIEEFNNQKKKRLSDFFGAVPGFPDRTPQGQFEERLQL